MPQKFEWASYPELVAFQSDPVLPYHEGHWLRPMMLHYAPALRNVPRTEEFMRLQVKYESLLGVWQDLKYQNLLTQRLLEFWSKVVAKMEVKLYFTF